MNINDAGNSAAASAGVYDLFTVTVDWEAGSGGPWSSEADLTVTTSSGSVNVAPPTSGSASNGTATTLTFSGFLPGPYDPSVNGTLDLTLNQSFGGSDANWSNISVTIDTAPPPPNCAELPIMPTDGAVNVSAFDPITISWTAPSSGPTPTSYDFYVGNMSDGSDQTLFVNTTDTFVTAPVGEYNTTIYWSVVPKNGIVDAVGCQTTVYSFTSEGPPAMTNDDCGNATLLTPGAVFTDNPIKDQTNIGTTNSEVGDPSIPDPGCANYAGGDVWYSVVVPSDGNLTIETNADPTGGSGDTGLAVYSGNCGSLVLVECDDDDSDDFFYSKVDIVPGMGLANQTVYVRVWEWGNDDSLEFQISAYSATLSANSVSLEEQLKFFPNPVKDNLSIITQQSIDRITILNMLGQDVLEASPNSSNVQLDMSTLETGAYFVKVQTASGNKTIRIIKD